MQFPVIHWCGLSLSGQQRFTRQAAWLTWLQQQGVVPVQTFPRHWHIQTPKHSDKDVNL